MASHPEVPIARLVHHRLVLQVDALARHDAGARLETDIGIYKMRFACRRLRAALVTFRPMLDQEQTEPIRAEIRWIAGVLGATRDEVLVRENLLDLLAAEPPEKVHGPVRERLLATYGDRAKPELREALASARYVQLRSSLDALVLDPPWSALAEAPVGASAPTLLRKEVRRFGKRTRMAAESEHVTEALHEARKAAKRLRFAAETLQPAVGKPARRLAGEAKQVTTVLGDLQDIAVSRAELLQLAEAAAASGEPTSTYGALQASLEIRADQLVASFWATDAHAALAALCRDAVRALGELPEGP